MMGSWITQVFTISWFNLKNIMERRGSSAATIVGVTGVVFVFIGVLSMAFGLQKTFESTGGSDNVIIMRAGSTDEMSSGLDGESARIIGDSPGILRNEAGPVASAELYVIVDVPKKGTTTEANVPLRGVSPAAFDVRERFEMVAGRRFDTGRNEIIVGAAAAGQFEGLELGSEHRWGESTWKVVGIFTNDGTVEDTEIWCDAKVLQPAYRRGNSYQSVHARLTSAAELQTFEDTLTTDPRLNVNVQPESDYYAGMSTALTGLIKVMGVVIGLLMGVGAVFGALNTMYTAVSARTREIATLRALGFGSSPVVISILIEAAILAAVGGVLGAGLAYAFFNGVQTATLNWQTFSQVAFAFTVTLPLMVGGFLYALLMGFVGGLFPAIRAARMPVASALREL